MANFNQHRDLWNAVIYGNLTESLAAASKLNRLGEMSENTFQIFVLASVIASTEKKGGKRK